MSDNVKPRHPNALANLEPATAALTHQAMRWRNSGLFPLCRKCILRDKCELYDRDDDDKTCPLAQQACADLMGSIVALDHIRPEDHPLVVEYCKQSIFVVLIDTWIGEAGIFLPGAEEGFLEPQPALTKLRYTAAGHVSRLSDRLGLNPSARAKLKHTGRLPGLADEMTKVILSLDAERQKEALQNEPD